MKKILISIIHKPLIVAVISLIIALGIGTVAYLRINKAPDYQFITVGPGTISDVGATSSTSSLEHLTLGFLTSGRIKDVSVKVGDLVKKDMTLASLDPESTLGAITQAQAAYSSANANYQKVLNGASGPTIDAAKVAVTSANTTLDEVTKQQNLLVANAYATLLNSTPQAYPANSTGTNDTPPTISGSYTLGKEGDINISTYESGSISGLSFTTTGLVSGTFPATSVTSQPLGNSGLSIQFPANAHTNQKWVISIPNTKAPNYLTNYNAYQSALQAKSQAIATAQSALDQANSNLGVVAATARPEDVATAKAQVESAYGALQIAQAAYKSRLIIAPGDGTVTAVYISPGDIATPNTPAIELSGSTFSKDVSIVIPNKAITNRDGKNIVLVKTAKGVEEREVTLGASDGVNTEIVSGLTAGDQIAFH